MVQWKDFPSEEATLEDERILQHPNLEFLEEKQYVDRHRVERHLHVVELVYFRLHPYKKTTINAKGSENLKSRFYGPYKVIRKVREVAYELELPMGSKIHNVFHVSCLKNVIGQNILVSYTLPPLDDKGQFVLIRDKILRTRGRRLSNRAIKEYLVQWKDIPSEEATWEDEQILQHSNLEFLEDKKYWVGRIFMSQSQ